MRIETIHAGPALLAGHHRVAVMVYYDRPGHQPEPLWFDMPEVLAEPGGTGNGWLVALLPLAFHLGEPLRLEASVDPVLLANAHRLQELWTRWFPERRPVPIEVAGLADVAARADSGTALMFSGGVDSFFSLLDFDRAARAGGSPPIADLIHIWGFDLPLIRRREYQRIATRFESLARRLDRRLITMATNLRETRLGSISWADVIHGPALGAAALLLPRPPAVVLLSASGARLDAIPYGTHPLSDRLMSTSQTSFRHYGIETSRVAKTALVAESAEALEFLHVCWHSESDRNCGRCLKCCLTQMALDLLGKRMQATVFRPERYSLQLVPTLRVQTHDGLNYMKELRGEAMARGRDDVFRAAAEFLAANQRDARRLASSKWHRTVRKWRNSIAKRRAAAARLVRGLRGWEGSNHAG